MSVVEKDILYPGRYHLPTGERWDCSHADVYSACANGSMMLKIGNTAPPLIWEHDWNVVPVPIPKLLSWLGNKVRDWAAGYAKHTFGYASGFRVGIEKGEPVLYAAHTIPLAADRDQFERTRFVSPRVDQDYTDHNGRLWRGTVIGHIASTPTPVQMRQRPVMLGSVKPPPCSSRLTVFLSLGGSDMADDADTGKNGDKPGGGDVWKRIKAALSTAGIQLPDGCNTPEEYALAIESATLNNGSGGNPPDDVTTTDDDFDDDAAGGGTSPALSPAMLSSIPGLSDEQRAGLGLVIEAQTTQVAAGRQQLLGRLARIEGAAIAGGHLTVPEANDMRAKFGAVPETVMLSWLAGKPAKSRAICRLEDLERLYRGGKKKPATVNLSRTTPVPTPTATAVPQGTRPEGVAAAVEATRKRLAKRREGDPAGISMTPAAKK